MEENKKDFDSGTKSWISSFFFGCQLLKYRYQWTMPKQVLIYLIQFSSIHMFPFLTNERTTLVFFSILVALVFCISYLTGSLHTESLKRETQIFSKNLVFFSNYLQATCVFFCNFFLPTKFFFITVQFRYMFTMKSSLKMKSNTSDENW